MVPGAHLRLPARSGRARAALAERLNRDGDTRKPDFAHPLAFALNAALLVPMVVAARLQRKLDLPVATQKQTAECLPRWVVIGTNRRAISLVKTQVRTVSYRLDMVNVKRALADAAENSRDCATTAVALNY